jgi:hypothetical protein
LEHPFHGYLQRDNTAYYGKRRYACQLPPKLANQGSVHQRGGVQGRRRMEQICGHNRSAIGGASMKVIYKIIYPNGKTYVGKDSTGDILRYFGSPDREYIEKDFNLEELQDITLRKKILFSSEDISESELGKKETEFIEKCGSNNPAKGYNLLPKFSG